MRRAAFAALALAATACGGGGEGRKAPESVFVGIDVSGSFQESRMDALAFLSHYLYARLNEKGALAPVKALYVGSIGGEYTEETKSFYPIHDFQGKTQTEILADLVSWFPKSDRMSDFSAFFKQVALISQKRNLALSPLTVVLLTDGVPDLTGRFEGRSHDAAFEAIDLEPLEFLSRRVTVRLLYPGPMVAARWESKVSRRRVRLWTVDEQVMSRWSAQLDQGQPAGSQPNLWRWIADNVDYRARSLRLGLKEARAAQEPLPERSGAAEPAPARAAPPAPSKAPAKAVPAKAGDASPKTGNAEGTAAPHPPEAQPTTKAPPAPKAPAAAKTPPKTSSKKKDR